MSNLSIFKFNGHEKVKLIKWNVKEGSPLSDGTILFTYNENGQDKKLKVDGLNYNLVVSLLSDENEFIIPGQQLFEYEKCGHTTVMKDLCAECGMDLRKTDNYENYASVSMIHSVPELKVSVEKAQQLGKEDEERLLSSRKLVLLVDLDQTLIHTTNNPTEQINNKEIISFRLYSSNSQLYYTKLRPYTEKFLNSIKELYELHICTFGTRMYAHRIAEILDPEKKLFSHRILSRDECFDPQLKTGNLNALFPCGDSMVCIIDDREDVWNYQPNMISVKPYNYFRNTGDINSPNKQKDELLAKAAKVLSNKDKDQKSTDEDDIKRDEDCDLINKKDKETLSQSKEEKINQIDKNESNENKTTQEESNKNESIKDESKEQIKNESNSKEKSDEIVAQKDDDDYLLYLSEILKKIHTKFYQEYNEILKYKAEGEYLKIPDLKNLIPSIRRQVLKGINIVFTGLIPTKLEPEQSKLWIVAKELGANVSKDIIRDGSPLEKTTHLVASSLNTLKVQEALKLKHIRVVNPIWLYVCSERWERVDERLYTLNKTDDFRNLDKLKNKLSLSEQLFLNYDLVKLSSLAKQSRQEKRLPTLQIPTQSSLNDHKQHSSITNKNNPFPVYDPITGKLIRTSDQQLNKQPSSSNVQQKQQLSPISLDDQMNEEDEDNLTPHSMVEFNPLAAFSDQELKSMDEEVDDACSDENDESSSSDQEALEQGEIENEFDEDEENNLYDYGDEPLTKKRKRDECLSASSSSSENTNLSFEDSNLDSNLDDVLGGQLEKDFLN